MGLTRMEMILLEGMCKRFARDVTVASPGRTDLDALAWEVWGQMNKNGQLGTETRRRLAKWCNTSLKYAPHMPLAREISTLIYGRVLDRELD